MEKDHLILRLEAPLMSFGSESVDSTRPTGDYPGLSLVTGLLANALGWRRTQPRLHQELQGRLVMACRVDRPHQGDDPGRITDLQTARIERGEEGWTTRGVPETRTGGDYHQEMMFKSYHSDRCVTVALRLEPANQPGQVSLENLQEALARPWRPLFIGRKGCVPSGPILRHAQRAETAAAALLAAPLPATASPGPWETGHETLAMTWPEGEGDPRVPAAGTLTVRHTRNWATRLHGGVSIIHQGHCPLSLLPREEPWTPPAKDGLPATDDGCGENSESEAESEADNKLVSEAGIITGSQNEGGAQPQGEEE